MSKIIIVDMDNCLSDDRWRRGLIDMTKTGDERYHRYHCQLTHDAVANLHILKTKHEIVICTGRPERYRDLTTLWLNKHQITTREVLMRDNNIHWPAAPMKVRMIQDYLLQTGHTIVHAYDDRCDVIDLYKSMGIQATRVFIHNDQIAIGL